MRLPFMRAGGPAVAAVLVGLAGSAAGADEPMGHERRPLDRAASERSPVALHQSGAMPGPSGLVSTGSPGETPARAKASKRLGAPQLADEPLSRHLNQNLAEGLGAALRPDHSSTMRTDAFDPRLSVGKFH